MPRHSLWLVPPANSNLSQTIQELISSQIPNVFPDTSPPNFTPHLTLTADTLDRTDLPDPQAWLDNIEVPDVSALTVTIQTLHVGAIFFQKLIILCEKTAELKGLAKACRAAGTGEGEDAAKEFVEEKWIPHVSLMYSDLPQDTVRAKLDDLQTKISELRVRDQQAASTAEGAAIWLVPTYKPIEDWKPIATRPLPYVHWEWRT